MAGNNKCCEKNGSGEKGRPILNEVLIYIRIRCSDPKTFEQNPQFKESMYLFGRLAVPGREEHKHKDLEPRLYLLHLKKSQKTTEVRDESVREKRR